MGLNIKHWTGLSLLVLVAACGNARRTPYTGDPSLPLYQVNPTEYCVQQADGTYKEKLVTDHGEADAFSWGQGGGCILRPIETAWGVLHNQPVMKWESVTTSTFKMGKPPLKTSHFYEVYYVVVDIQTVKWTMQWYHTLLEGTKQDPKKLIVNYKRVAGTEYIPYWQGTIMLQEIEPGVTAFAMRNEIKAERTTSQDAADTVSDVYHKVRRRQPVPIP